MSFERLLFFWILLSLMVGLLAGGKPWRFPLQGKSIIESFNPVLMD